MRLATDSGAAERKSYDVCYRKPDNATNGTADILFFAAPYPSKERRRNGTRSGSRPSLSVTGIMGTEVDVFVPLDLALHPAPYPAGYPASVDYLSNPALFFCFGG